MLTRHLGSHDSQSWLACLSGSHIAQTLVVLSQTTFDSLLGCLLVYRDLEGVLGLNFRDLEGVLGLSFRDLERVLGLSFRDLEGGLRSSFSRFGGGLRSYVIDLRS